MVKRMLTASLIAPLLAAAIALPVLATEGANTNMNANANTNSHMMKPKKADRMAKVDGACMSTAVSKRDDALVAAVDVSATAVKNALNTRKAALKAAWALTDGRSDALKAAWTTYRAAVKAAKKTLRDGRLAAWKTFRTDAKACGTGATSADAGGEGADTAL